MRVATGGKSKCEKLVCSGLDLETEDALSTVAHLRWPTNTYSRVRETSFKVGQRTQEATGSLEGGRDVYRIPRHVCRRPGAVALDSSFNGYVANKLSRIHSFVLYIRCVCIRTRNTAWAVPF